MLVLLELEKVYRHKEMMETEKVIGDNDKHMCAMEKGTANKELEQVLEMEKVMVKCRPQGWRLQVEVEICRRSGGGDLQLHNW